MIAAASNDQDQGPTTHSSERTEGALINVTMEGAVIHIRPVGRVDADMVATIAELLVSARAAGTEPVLDLGGLDPTDRDAWRALGEVIPTSVA